MITWFEWNLRHCEKPNIAISGILGILMCGDFLYDSVLRIYNSKLLGMCLKFYDNWLCRLIRVNRRSCFNLMFFLNTHFSKWWLIKFYLHVHCLLWNDAECLHVYIQKIYLIHASWMLSLLVLLLFTCLIIIMWSSIHHLFLFIACRMTLWNQTTQVWHNVTITLSTLELFIHVILHDHTPTLHITLIVLNRYSYDVVYFVGWLESISEKWQDLGALQTPLGEQAKN